MKNKLIHNRFEVFFGALLLQVVYPFLSLLLVIPLDTMRLVSFTILVLASFNLALKKLPRLLIISLGVTALLGLWCQYLFGDPYFMHLLRIYTTCFFYTILVYVLTRNFLVTENINLKVVFGAMSGYLLIGYLGASTIEMMEFHHQGSFKINDAEPFDFIYYGFISMLTVGFGDIVPLTPSAKSLTILISIIGQLYMAVGIASFVGKFMKYSN